jgi:hypothetical protein
MNRSLDIFATILFALAAPLAAVTPLKAATSSILCGTHTVTVSTGGDGGACVKSGTVITCNASGTSVGGGCDGNGQASCGNSVGAGTCNIKKTVKKPPDIKMPSPTAARP